MTQHLMDKVVCIECTVKAASQNHAETIFQLASNRLLLAHDWSSLSDSLLPTSDHRDANGAPVSRPVETDDYINLTNDDQRLFGWMQVLDVVKSTASNREVTVLTLPIELPFEGESVGERNPTLLRVVRRGLDVTAAFTIETNPLTPVFARIGVYMVQWRSLVNGLLSDLTPLDSKMKMDTLAGTQRFA